MNWETLIAPGAMIGLAALGGYGWMRDLRAKFEANGAETNRRLTEGEADRKDLRARLDTIERDGVRRNDLAAVKGEIIERLKDVEHTFRGVQATAIGEMREMVKTLLERALGARP